MKITKIRDVITPMRGTKKSAGLDFYVPRFDDEFIKDFLEKNQTFNKYIETASYLADNYICLFPGDRVLIPSGIKVNFIEEADKLRKKLGASYGLVLCAKNKSGVGSKLGLDHLASEIDEDYQGEIHINLVNTGSTPVNIAEHQKIIQFELTPVDYCKIEEVSIDKLYIDTTSERGEGGFGSTDKK